MMKLPLFVAALAIAGVANAQTFNLVPNGDFSTPDGADWVFDNGGSAVAVSYPTTGGNTGGYGQMDATGGWGVFVSPVDVNGLPLSALGVTAGGTYDFKMDMNLLSGSTLGGLKIESWAAGGHIGNSGDVRPALIGTGGTWETYTFSYTIVAGADALKLVPLWGDNSSVGFDNLGVMGAAIPEPSAFALLGGLFALGFMVRRRR